MSDLTLQRAWLAYWTTMRNDPDAAPEQRQRAADMLAKTQLYPSAAADTATTTTAAATADTEDLV